MATYDSSRIAKPSIVDPVLREGDELEHDLDAQADEQQPEHLEVQPSESRPKLPFVATTTTIATTNVATKKITRTPYRRRVRATQVSSANVYELRSSSEGTVIRVDVDEGQMVAEDDEIAVLDTENGRVAVVTDVPGVVRELYVEAGYSVTPGTVIALIDES